MADRTSIEWTDATVNFWWGCTKVGPGCDHCYAETWSERFGGGLWGIGAPRRKIKGAVKLIHKLDNDYSWWAADAEIGKIHPNSRRRVFIQSMSDLFDKEVPLEWFAEAWQHIAACDRLEIQIVTKRISFVERRLEAIGGTWPQHAGLIISIVNQEEADRDIPRLLELKARLGIPWVGLSMEPLLGPVDIGPWIPTCYECGASCGLRLASMPDIERCTECGEECGPDTEPVVSEGCPKCSGELEPVCPDCGHYMVYQHPDTPFINWIIAGGESGPGARPMHPDWARSLRDQCAAAGVPFFFKQWGGWLPIGQEDSRVFPLDRAQPMREELGFEGGGIAQFVGKKAAGRLLDGVEHNGMPGQGRVG